MAVPLEDHLAKLSPGELRAIESRTRELIEEEGTLQELRQCRRRSQEQIAERLGVKQSAVSRLERRTDMYLSTLRGLIRAMGGDLEIIARFPDRPPLRLTQFRD